MQKIIINCVITFQDIRLQLEIGKCLMLILERKKKHLSNNECLMVQRCKDKIQMFRKIRIQTDRMK